MAPETQASSRVARKRTETRTRLYQAAVSLFVERGYEATTMSDIAERADTARGTAFNHFPTKGDFTMEWTRRRRDQAAYAVTETSTQVTIIDRLRAYFHHLAIVNERELELTTQMLLGWVRAGGPVHDDPWLANELVPWIQNGQDCNELTAQCSPLLVANLLRDAYLGVLFRWLHAGDYVQGKLVNELDTTIELVLDGIRPRNEGRSRVLDVDS